MRICDQRYNTGFSPSLSHNPWRITNSRTQIPYFCVPPPPKKHTIIIPSGVSGISCARGKIFISIPMSSKKCEATFYWNFHVLTKASLINNIFYLFTLEFSYFSLWKIINPLVIIFSLRTGMKIRETKISSSICLFLQPTASCTLFL